MLKLIDADELLRYLNEWKQYLESIGSKDAYVYQDIIFHIESMPQATVKDYNNEKYNSCNDSYV